MVADAEDVPPITASPIPNCHWLLQFLTAEIYPSSLIQTFPSYCVLQPPPTSSLIYVMRRFVKDALSLPRRHTKKKHSRLLTSARPCQWRRQDCFFSAATRMVCACRESFFGFRLARSSHQACLMA